jgi:DeoR family fructose operon transcriptional repressor
LFFLLFIVDYSLLYVILGDMVQEKEGAVMFAEERKQQILEIIHKNRKIVVPELCNYFGVSASTIRNDLRGLTDANLITRTHGGALSNSKVSLEPLPQDKQSQMYPQKAAIARRAAELVDDGDVIALCTGTSVMELAKCLLGKKKLTVVVNDILIASFLEEKSDFSLFMLGGIIRKGFHYASTNGALLPKINIDKAFFSCNGLNAGMGATVPDFNLAMNVAEILTTASESILLCDSSKIGILTFAQIAPLERIDAIVIDDDANPQELQELSVCESCRIIAAPVRPLSNN